MRTVSAGIRAVLIFAGGALAAQQSPRSGVPRIEGPAAGPSRHYRKGFQQESVLWETARVCAAA